MTTPQGDYMKSPFDHVFSFVPQGHEKALKHALYNAVALFLLMVGLCVGYAVCFILEPFIKPLLWALLCGSVLHPFKHSLVTNLRSWIQNLRSSSTPFVFGLAMTPVRVVDKVSDYIGSFIHQYLFPIVAVVIALPTSMALYHYTPRLLVCFIQFIGSYTFNIISWVVGCLSFKLLLAAGIAHAVWLVMTGGHNGRASLISCVLWLAGVCYCAAAILGGASPAWNVASFVLTMGVFTLGLGTEVLEIHGARQEQGSDASMIDTLKLVLLQEDVPELLNVSKEEDEAEKKEEQEEVKTIEAAVEAPVVIQTPDTVDRPHKSLAFRNPLTPHNLLGGRGSLTLLASSTPLTFRQRVRMNESILQASLSPPEGLTSNHCLIAVGWACIVMLLWKHMWCMSLLPVPLALYFIKTAGKYFGVWSLLNTRLRSGCGIVQTWCEERQNILLPPAIKGLVKIVGKVNQGVTGALESSINMAATVFVICGLIVFAISTSIFIAVQVYAEGVHVVQVTAEVVNNTVVNNPELLQMLPAGIGDAVSQMLDNAYQYGREGISSMVRGMLNSQVDPAKAAQLEQQVLELWDRVYQAWVMSSAAAAGGGETEVSGTTSGPSVSSDAVLSSWESLVTRLTSTPELLDFGALTEWLKTNVDTLMSLMETVWALLKGNISLVFGSVTALMSLLLGGGTALLNFLFSLVVFFTALFYLLSASGALYKPVELMTNFGPNNGKKFAGAFEAAINGVFTASFKMALFYGLWTWLIHNLFQVKVVYLPSALAAVLGAVPFLGTYWASFPATLELWLAQGRGLEALALLVCHLLPASMVDTTIYKEIKGGGHPYLTGLAVAGGILCLGVEGAIVGPLLLCCLIVAINMSSRLMKESPGPEEERMQAITLRSLRRTVPRC